MLSRHHARQNTKNRLEQLHRLVEIESVAGWYGIGGELGVPCTTNRLYGGLNALGRRKRLIGSCMRTLMSRPHMIRVLRTVSGGKREPNNRGNRSGRERSIPTWGHGCCGDPGRRKCVDTACGYERPPEDSHLDIKHDISVPARSFKGWDFFPLRQDSFSCYYFFDDEILSSNGFNFNFLFNFI